MIGETKIISEYILRSKIPADVEKPPDLWARKTLMYEIEYVITNQ